MDKPFMESRKKITVVEAYALVFGLFLGLAILKFGNPVILDYKIIPPGSFSDFWHNPWPTHWANWILLPLALLGAILAFTKNPRWPQTKWLWLLPLGWFGWQILSATRTVDHALTAATLWQFFGCVACYFLGAFVFGNERAIRWLFIGLLTAFAFCLVRAVDQKLYEFPQGRQMLLEGERNGWTNFPPAMIAEMKSENIIITTNGVDAANPAILEKFTKGRVNGTMVYPNALAGIILLLFPISLTLVSSFTKKLRPAVRFVAIALILFLGGTAFFGTGSKLGWLIAVMIGSLWLFRLNWPVKLKMIALIVVVIFGLGIFAIRFHNYFSNGATSVGARLDYWRAAIQTTGANPLFGTGPGTFQRPYARIKSPESEMARLAHNDYLEQFSDSGIAGGFFYIAWIATSLVVVGRKSWSSQNFPALALFIGLLGWFSQGIGEFGLFIPAAAWTAFTLLGCLTTLSASHFGFDKKSTAR